MQLKVKFLEDRTVRDGSGLKFRKGQVVELPYASAQHWLTRNVAVLVIEDGKPSAVTTPQAKSEKSTAKAIGSAKAV